MTVDEVAFTDPEGVAPRVVDLQHAVLVPSDDHLVAAAVALDVDRDRRALVRRRRDVVEGSRAVRRVVEVMLLVVEAGGLADLVIGRLLGLLGGHPAAVEAPVAG